MPRTKVPLFYHTPPLQKSPHGTIRHFCKTQGLIKYKKEACAVFLRDSVANHQMPVPPFMPASIHSTLQYKLPQKNENDYNELFISMLAHLFPISLNINCYYVIKVIQMIKQLI
jgi:hypothetical protein